MAFARVTSAGRLLEFLRLAIRLSCPGAHQITFDGTKLFSGIYIYRITAGDFTETGKMVLMKQNWIIFMLRGVFVYSKYP